MPLELLRAVPWSPHPTAAALTGRAGEGWTAAANGTRTLAGGWQLTHGGVVPGRSYRITVATTFTDLPAPVDNLRAIAYWGEPDPTADRPGIVRQEYLHPTWAEGAVTFARTVTAPAGAELLTLRLIVRWSATGQVVWQPPTIVETTLDRPAPVRVAVVTGPLHGRPRVTRLEDNVDWYLPRCEAACREDAPRLIVLPEICLQWGLPGSPLERAVEVPGPVTEPWRELARRERVRLCLGLLERDGDAAYNAAILIGPDGEIDGRYRKVHLAAGGEDVSGLLPGDGFPVFETEVGRLGCAICMDSSAAESARLVGLGGADFLLLPIMGDHRADRFSPGQPVFCEDRWRAIQRVRALDNQLTMVIARNTSLGSCVIDPKGEILAWNEGDRDHIAATVDPRPDYRDWLGASLADVNWMQRRPGVYGPFVDPTCRGSVR